jgi:hypothetical protein
LPGIDPQRERENSPVSQKAREMGHPAVLEKEAELLAPPSGRTALGAVDLDVLTTIGKGNAPLPLWSMKTMELQRRGHQNL